MHRMEKIWQAVFLVGLMVLPFIYAPASRVAFEVPRGWFVMGWVEVLLILQLFCRRINRRVEMWLALVMALLFGVMLLSSIMNGDMLRGIVGNYYRADGLLLYLHMGLLALMVAWQMKRGLLEKVFVVLGVDVLLLSVWALVSGAWQRPLWGTSIWADGIGLSFGNPNYLAGFMLVGMPAVWWLAGKIGERWGKQWMTIAQLVPLIGLYLTGSRSALIVLGLFWLLWWLVFESKRSMQWVAVLVGGMFAVVALAWVLLDTKNAKSEFTYESRERIVRKLVLGWREQPLFGYGWARVDAAFPVVDWPYRIVSDIYVDKAHSHLLEFLVTTGVVGLGLYLLFWAMLAQKVLTIIRTKQDGERVHYQLLLITLGVYFLHTQTNIVSAAEEVVWFVMVGFSLSRSHS